MYRPASPIDVDDGVYRSRPPAGQTPGGSQSRRTLLARRLVFATLVVGTLAALAAAMLAVLAHGGVGLLDGVLFTAFLISAPWTVIGFWNAVIGLAVLHLTRDPEALIAPYARRADPAAPIAGRVALAMTIRNEDPARAFGRLKATRAALDATAHGARFDVHVLSDSSRPDVIAGEEAAFAAWRAALADPERVHYRRRPENTGFKAGNLRDFVEGAGVAYDLMIPLDADSLMSAETILRLVRISEANPAIGILQSLVVGLPAPSLFARLFQFGMRHGMRAYTTGSAWWHGDCGPFWGHNAVVRVAAFRDHCRLPVLPGGPPLGGVVLSHDQIEAAMMRRAGYEVRVLVEEAGSFEENPPALPDFLKRALRWCQGNMQYFRLLALPGLLPVSRMQVFLAIQMYLGAAGWMVFILAGALAAILPPPATDAPFPKALALGLFVTMFAMSLAPKAMGVVDALLRPGERRRYGGAGRLVGGALLEFATSTLIAPAVAAAETIFMLGLPFGRRVGWDGQTRDGYRLTWRQAIVGLWPQVVLGAALAAVLALAAPAVLPWAAPVILGLALAPAFAVVTALPGLGAWAARHGLCAIPEENDPPAIFAGLVDPAAMPPAGRPAGAMAAE